MGVRLEAHFDFPRVDRWFVLLSYFVDDVVENFDLINADLDTVRDFLLGLVSLFEPGVRHDLFKPVAQLRVRHQDVLDQALNLLAEVASELVARIQDLLVEALGV